ncbi:hypothetical protein B0I35DRAFT_430758 [Stachybotrys elegans]|uniref:Uncharacterized protein n=1 Tax=Stachybotrys elegans TaxID=80388 RepID=A0A8K0ST57_9HYPO|nr:hypothetical protein B0I35DRAFT_430758 [Stachybotrys elegans]
MFRLSPRWPPSPPLGLVSGLVDQAVREHEPLVHACGLFPVMIWIDKPSGACSIAAGSGIRRPNGWRLVMNIWRMPKRQPIAVVHGLKKLHPVSAAT